MTDFKDTKEVLAFGFKVSEEIVSVYEDGNVSWTEIMVSGATLLGTGRSGLDGLTNVPKEFDEATSEDKDELKKWVIDNFSFLDDDNLEMRIELIINWVLDTISTAYSIKALSSKDFSLDGVEKFKNISF